MSSLAILESEAVLETSADHKATQAVSVNSNGTRMVTGGIDGVLKYWDFHGMNRASPRPFRELVPVEGHTIVGLSYNVDGSLVLCVTSDAKARVFDKEGSIRPVEETIKGDPYIRTPENTKGHTHSLTGGAFHPADANRFMTSSQDSTVRLWDLNTKRVGMDQNIPNLNCFKCVDARNVCGGNKMWVSSACYSSEGSQVVAGCSDGSIHFFQEKMRYGKGTSIIRSAHEGTEVTAVKFFSNNTHVASRGMDDCVKLWDVRNVKSPVKIFSPAETVRSFSNITLSPDEQFMVIGSAKGELVCYDMQALEEIGRKKLPANQLIRVEWNGVLNQIISTSADGNVFISYSESESTPNTGALAFVNKAPGVSRSNMVSSSRVTNEQVFAYDELLDSGKYRENKTGQIKQIQQRIPRPAGEYIPTSSDAVLDALKQPKRARTLESVQRDLLAFDEAGEGLVSDAYKTTQPNAVLDYSDVSGKVDSLLNQKVYCPKCGLKMCSCGFMRPKPGSAAPVQKEGPLVPSKRPLM